MLNRSASLVMSTGILKLLPGKLDIKRHSPIPYIWASLAMLISILKALPGKLDTKRHSPTLLYLFGNHLTEEESASCFACCSRQQFMLAYASCCFILCVCFTVSKMFDVKLSLFSCPLI